MDTRYAAVNLHKDEIDAVINSNYVLAITEDTGLLHLTQEGKQSYIEHVKQGMINPFQLLSQIGINADQISFETAVGIFNEMQDVGKAMEKGEYTQYEPDKDSTAANRQQEAKYNLTKNELNTLRKSGLFLLPGDDGWEQAGGTGATLFFKNPDTVKRYCAAVKTGLARDSILDGVCMLSSKSMRESIKAQIHGFIETKIDIQTKADDIAGNKYSGNGKEKAIICYGDISEDNRIKAIFENQAGGRNIVFLDLQGIEKATATGKLIFEGKLTEDNISKLLSEIETPKKEETQEADLRGNLYTLTEDASRYIQLTYDTGPDGSISMLYINADGIPEESSITPGTINEMLEGGIIAFKTKKTPDELNIKQEIPPVEKQQSIFNPGDVIAIPGDNKAAYIEKIFAESGNISILFETQDGILTEGTATIKDITANIESGTYIQVDKQLSGDELKELRDTFNKTDRQALWETVKNQEKELSSLKTELTNTISIIKDMRLEIAELKSEVVFNRELRSKEKSRADEILGKKSGQPINATDTPKNKNRTTL